MAASNQKRFSLAPDNTIEELWNGAKKYQHLHVDLVKCVEDFSFNLGLIYTGEFFKNLSWNCTGQKHLMQLHLFEKLKSAN